MNEQLMAAIIAFLVAAAGWFNDTQRQMWNVICMHRQRYTNGDRKMGTARKCKGNLVHLKEL